jgi:hypothetical protein
MLWRWGITVTGEAALDAAVAKLSAPEGSRGPSSPHTITLYGVAEGIAHIAVLYHKINGYVYGYVQ